MCNYSKSFISSNNLLIHLLAGYFVFYIEKSSDLNLKNFSKCNHILKFFFNSSNVKKMLLIIVYNAMITFIVNKLNVSLQIISPIVPTSKLNLYLTSTLNLQKFIIT